ncbi:prephenate dehydrogenase/arogenate dehydrogenase family protein [Candidatus Gracilibacteria bacterium]|nr:prephenate dehydrogenase/arogenate dehydrogenase family protein [Candidatus Gracilibacteria bacterium]
MKGPVIAIIGGKGVMGREFGRILKNAKADILTVDLGTSLTLEQAAERADIIFFATPISLTPDLIRRLKGHIKHGSLITDITSLKVPVMQAMREVATIKTELLGMHPLFGPSVVSNMKNQVIAMCPEGSGQWTRWITTVFQKQGAVMQKTTAEKHDSIMAIIQGITHFSAIASGIALRELGVDLQETLKFASPIYDLRFAMIGRILSQSPQLYADIEIQNPHTLKAVKAYQEAIEELSKAVAKKDTTAFKKLFSEAAKYMGDFKEKAQKKTDAVIRKMSEK